MRVVLYCLLLFLFSCQKDASDIHENGKSGIDLSVDRTVIDGIITELYNPRPKVVLVASHRGDANRAPENTIAAVQAAIDGGASIVEIDVRKTRDNKLVVIHDSDLDRTTNGTGKISERSLAYIKTLKTKDRNGKLTEHEIPTLKELMLYAKGKCLVFIDKGEAYWPRIYDILMETKSIDHALVIENYELSKAKSEMGLSMFNKIHYFCRLRQTDDDAPELFTDYINEKIPGFEFRFHSENAPVLNRIGTTKSVGKHVWMSTLNDKMAASHTDEQSLSNPEDGWGWCIKKGATIILTDYPEQLTQYLDFKGLKL